MQMIGKRLDSTRDTYENAMKKLSIGQGNVVRQVEQLKEMGARTSKILPQSVVDTVSADTQRASECVSFCDIWPDLTWRVWLRSVATDNSLRTARYWMATGQG